MQPPAPRLFFNGISRGSAGGVIRRHSFQSLNRRTFTPFSLLTRILRAHEMITAILNLRKLFSWLRGYSAGFADQSRLPDLVAGLEAGGFQLFFLDGQRISGESDFFREVQAALEFPAYFGHNWSAFIDSLGDLERRPARRVGVIWKHADLSARHDVAVFVEAVHWFLSVGADLRTPTLDRHLVTQLELLLVGAWANAQTP